MSTRSGRSLWRSRRGFRYTGGGAAGFAATDLLCTLACGEAGCADGARAAAAAAGWPRWAALLAWACPPACWLEGRTALRWMDGALAVSCFRPMAAPPDSCADGAGGAADDDAA